MQLFELELFMLCHHLAKFRGQRYCSSRDMFLVCHVIKQNHVIKGSDDYDNRTIGAPSKSGGHRQCSSGDIMVLTTLAEVRATLWVGAA